MPPMNAERVTTNGSCARRSANSATRSPRAACVIRAAFVAISVARLMAFSRPDSSSSASRNGPVTRINGSFGKAIEPSGIAAISPLKRKFRSSSR